MNAYIAGDQSLPLHDRTVGQLLNEIAAKAPDAPAIRQPPQGTYAGSISWTYAELLAHSTALARHLLGRFQRGDHVVIWASNSAEWALYQLAAGLAGITLVTANPALRTHEMRYLLGHSQAAGVILQPEYRGTDLTEILSHLRPELPALREVLFVDSWADYVGEPSGRDLPTDIAPDETALIIYTSGTTGAPKAVRLHHRGIVNNADLGSTRYGLAERSVWLHTLPMFHIGGAVTATLGCMARTGVSIILRSFDPATVLKLCETERVAMIPAVPTMLHSMVEHPTFAETDLSSLQLVVTGGTTITPEFVRMARARVGCDVQVMFGQTEAGGPMTKTLRTDSPELIASSVGAPYPHTNLKIASLETGGVCEIGQIGEIRISSPFMMHGYYRNPQADADAFDGEGFLRTGDLGYLGEDGRLRVTGRLKEMIIRGGENIYPREVEDALAAYPGVAEAAVFGLSNAKWGEQVAAAVRPLPGAVLDVASMVEYLRSQIARHKVPEHWRIVDDFPRTSSGKIQKFALGELFNDAAAEAGPMRN